MAGLSNASAFSARFHNQMPSNPHHSFMRLESGQPTGRVVHICNLRAAGGRGQGGGDECEAGLGYIGKPRLTK